MSRWKSRLAARPVALPPVIATRRMSMSGDTARLCAIDADCSDPGWAIHDWRRVFRDPLHGGTVVTSDGNVVGFATYQINGIDATISNFGIDPRFRRMGAGRAMIHSLLTEPPASFDGSRFVRVRPGKVIFHCHEEQLGFQLFLKACSVPAVTVYRRYYRTDGRDCFLFAKVRG